MKAIAILLVAVMALFAVAPGAMARETGGLVGGIIGCCFGVRSAASFNDGKDLHWREWGRIIPLADIVFVVWDAVDGMNGLTTADFVSQYGSNYY